ncbi:MAG: glycoside hydrolase, partial [Flavobacteriales bacterium]|nr:glycoside hydrolase [Flavobacteriales bacterium]
INANWVAWVPYAFCDVKTGHLKQHTDWQWKGETPEGTVAAIKLAKRNGLKVMLKPHVWLSNHSFTGTMHLKKAQWQIWKTDFEAYILYFAKLAQANNVELFCIGTEQFAAIQHDPEFWLQLITEVRKIYKGKLTYAANWDTYKRCHFWKELDFIGIDAYMPISEKATPTAEQLQRNWKFWKIAIRATSRKYDTPVLFTEFGYRTTEYATTEPWKGVTEHTYCEPCQATAFQAVFNTFWSEEWFAGGFIWKWFEPNRSVSYEHAKSYFAKGKLAEKTITNQFQQTAD